MTAVARAVAKHWQFMIMISIVTVTVTGDSLPGGPRLRRRRPARARPPRWASNRSRRPAQPRSRLPVNHQVIVTVALVQAASSPGLSQASLSPGPGPGGPGCRGASNSVTGTDLNS